MSEESREEKFLRAIFKKDPVSGAPIWSVTCPNCTKVHSFPFDWRRMPYTVTLPCGYKLTFEMEAIPEILKDGHPLEQQDCLYMDGICIFCRLPWKRN